MPDSLPRVAYFCMEYGLDDRLKIYAGGLGILAGDHLKGAHDMGAHLVGIGIKWKQGYGRQIIDEDGQPAVVFTDVRYDDLLEDTGVEVTVTIQREDVRIKVWKVDRFGNAPLYLLDANLPDNPHAWTTSQLYGGLGEVRVAQEIILGVGGVRALRALGIDVDVYHFNEGHALLAAFELIREKRDNGMSYEDAFAATREEVVFTTHTPVVAGNESHPIERLQYLGADLGLTAEQLENIGGSPFGMTVGALRLARKANAVAQLHGETANKMWAHVEGRPEIIAITNCIHPQTWVDGEMLRLAEGDSDDELWERHQANKRDLITLVRERTSVELKEDVLLIGFARRAVAYKRPPLIFSDPERIAPLLRNGRLQLLFSGKAHLMDEYGKALISELVVMQDRYPGSVVFLEDYAMHIGKLMTRGSDVWLNNPRRPQEASGTSGMKAAMNGVLNASVLDGWWPEACQDGVNGWDIGGGFESDNLAELDHHDREALYDVVLNKIVPTYYDHPTKWRAMMLASIESTRDRFSTDRMLPEYYERLYTT
ncbi:alpha-glucan family phosphorylase [soil metagenome]